VEPKAQVGALPTWALGFITRAVPGLLVT